MSVVTQHVKCLGCSSAHQPTLDRTDPREDYSNPSVKRCLLPYDQDCHQPKICLMMDADVKPQASTKNQQLGLDCSRNRTAPGLRKPWSTSHFLHLLGFYVGKLHRNYKREEWKADHFTHKNIILPNRIRF